MTLILAKSSLASPASRDSIIKLMNTTGASNMSSIIVQQMLPALRQMSPEIPQTFWDKEVSLVDTKELVELLIPLYQRNLSEEDLKSINQFYESAVGQKLIKAQPVMVRESMEIGEQWGYSIAKRITQKYQASDKTQSPTTYPSQAPSKPKTPAQFQSKSQQSSQGTPGKSPTQSPQTHSLEGYY